MEIYLLCRTLSRARLKTVHDFILDHPDVLKRLPPGTQDAFLKICGAISHLRSRKAKDFFIRTLQNLETLRDQEFAGLIAEGAIRLGVENWAMVQPYFESVGRLPQDEDSLQRWTVFALGLAEADIDTAVAYVRETPRALETFGPERFLSWGEQALDAVQENPGMGKAARAYLEEAVANHCAIPLGQWGFLLREGTRIAARSAAAAEAFIRLGSRLCLLLNDTETERWITEGIESCVSEDDLMGYFSGTLSGALEKRNGLASGIPLEERTNTLSLICEAYLGRSVKIRPNTPLTGVKGFTGGAATDGRTVYLPIVAGSFGLFKLMALHQSSLLALDDWRESAMRAFFDPVGIHLKADRMVLGTMPTLLREMRQAAQGELPPSYPDKVPREFKKRLPWWGDLLPELVTQTQETMQRLLQKAEEQTDLPPKVVEALLSYMMAEGHREDRGLWEKLQALCDDLEFASPDPEELQESFKTFFYKEWDADLSDYKLDWCLVRQRVAKSMPNPFVENVRTRMHGLIALIRRQFMRLKPEGFRRLRAQETGDDLDLEALIPALVEMRAGASPSDGVYIRRDKRTRDVAVLFLLDMSASTAERVHGRRVIDIQKEAMVLMAEALDSLGDPFAIYGFSSEGRFRVDLFSVKEFGEPYSDRVQTRLGGLEPKELTRLGAVIRHGIYKLEGVQALIKLMVILTDGRPYDLEYGGLKYAIEDTKRAVQEARRRKIHPFIITSDQRGSDYIKRICPETRSMIVPRVERLPMVLPAMYKRLTT